MGGITGTKTMIGVRFDELVEEGLDLHLGRSEGEHARSDP